MAEARFWRANAIALGLDPETDPADVMLVQRGEHGLQPRDSVKTEYDRTWRWLQEERKAPASASP